ncbi:MAG: radical SAM protein [Gemmatimonadetes bacterium]|nr:radical SAM protein [Gemmatimonadota bacterium]MBT6148232.1 radical SAM protein [Gemmatimonadota bacterium]MBT7860349.1 radical SAM protein [Gemmatimonadota bacterium]
MLDLSNYHAHHRARLEALLAEPAWQTALASGLVEATRDERVAPGTTRDFIGTVVDQLVAFNGAAVQDQIADGCNDRLALADTLGTWPAHLNEQHPLLSFLGLTLTYGCNFDPRCSYCTQKWQEPAVDAAGWKRVIDEATTHNEGAGPYVYITGGEVLTLEEDIWGDDGIIAHASRRGAAVNVNTNASLITPQIALRLIKVGTAKLHISLDTPDEDTQDMLWGEEGRAARVLEGICHLQLARDLTGGEGPEIHINCVLTRHNLDHVDELFAFLLERKKRVPKGHPLFYDLLPHLIPVGGDANDELRPTAADVERLYGRAWATVESLWDNYQAELGMVAEDRGALFGPFRNPYQRVDQSGNLADYANNAAHGHYGRLSLSRACYVAPTQASITPDGLQYRCGAHAVRRHLPIGDVAHGSVTELIRHGIASLADLPQPQTCESCALATVYINQSVEHKLEERVDEWLAPATPNPD